MQPRRMVEGPADLQAAYNELVSAVRRLQKLSAAAPLGVRWIAGAPTLFMAEGSAEALMLGVAEAECPPGESAEVRRWTWREEEPEETDEVVEAANWFHDSIAEGSRVVLARIAGRWVFAAESALGPEVKSFRAPLAEVAGWDDSAEQVLSHDGDGILRWIDVAECE